MQKMMRLNDELCGVKSVGISGHIRPDGDCVGSTMALYLYIKKNFPEIDVHIYLEDAPKIFDCIEAFEDIENAEKADRDFDVFILSDVSKERSGNAEKLFDRAKKKINIDHHVTNPGSGDVNYIVPTASSAAELVFDVLDEPLLDKEIAKAIYIGIIHDTGVFQYSNVSPKTFETAAKLISYGFDFPKLIDETFYEKTYLQSQLLGRVLSESILLMDGRVAVGVMKEREINFYGSVPADYEGIVNQLRLIKGVDVAIFMHELKDHTFKVSLRSSTDDINVSEVCAYFGGGGHVRAAGVTMEGNFYDVVNNLTKELEKQYAKRNN